MPRKAWSIGSPSSAAYTILWGKKRSRRSPIHDDATRVSLGHQPPDPLRLPAQTQLVAQPDRDLLRHPPTKMPSRRELHLGARTRIPNPRVHHLLQHDHGPSLQLDLHRQTPPEETPPPFRSAPPPRSAAR